LLIASAMSKPLPPRAVRAHRHRFNRAANALRLRVIWGTRRVDLVTAGAPALVAAAAIAMALCCGGSCDRSQETLALAVESGPTESSDVGKKPRDRSGQRAMVGSHGLIVSLRCRAEPACRSMSSATLNQRRNAVAMREAKEGSLHSVASTRDLHTAAAEDLVAPTARDGIRR
jgi:hypothetical protein